MTEDPFEAHLQRAEACFQSGDPLRAGQIWQAILKRVPDHAVARQGLIRVKQALEAHAQPAVSKEELDTLLRQASQLWDLGVPDDAIEKWEKVLQVDPENSEAKTFIAMVKKEQAEAAAATAPTHRSRTPHEEMTAALPISAPKRPDEPLPRPAPSASKEELDTLLRQASQLWDLGVPDDAIEKWEKVLQLDPENADAKAFLGMVKKEQAEAAAAQPKPAPPPPPAARDEMTATLPTMVHEGEDPRMLQGEHLLVLERFEEAIYAFQQALAHQPGNSRAKEGLARAQAGVTALREPDQPAPSREVVLPATLTTTAPPRRLGLNIPAPLKRLAAHPLARSPVLWGVLLGSVLITSIGITYWRQAAKDRQLRADVSRAIQESIAPVLRASVILDLNETPASILEEGKAVLSEDPLRAYHRAKEALRRSPQDAAAAQLLEAARGSLSKGVPLPEGTWEAQVKVGNLDGAIAIILGQLRSAPEDPALLRNATTLLSSRAQIQASKGNLGAAKEDLMRLRAFYPDDKAWNARIQLLDHIQAQPKAEQAGWIALLG